MTVTVHAAVARGIVGTPKVTVTMPLDWAVRGFVDAARRFRDAAATQQTNARDVCIALLEAAAWIDMLAERTNIASDAHANALRFVRARTYHHWAAPVFFEEQTGEWTWYRLETLPLGNPAFPNTKGERLYRAVLGGRPAREAVDRAEKAVRALAPDAFRE